MIYLGGPYSSQTFEEHKLNIGRFMCYKIWIYIDGTEDMPVVCWPLETSGFDYGERLSQLPWLQWAIQLCGRVTFAAFVPGWERSPGSQQELEYFKKAGIPVRLLPYIGADTAGRIKTELTKMGRYCTYGAWAKAYLKHILENNHG